MTERWQSSKKKWCEICHCYFADNPNAIRHHEAGMRHKANVQEKISSIGRKQREKEKEARETNAILAKMNSAAYAASAKDAVDAKCAPAGLDPQAMPHVGPSPSDPARPVGNFGAVPRPDPQFPWFKDPLAPAPFAAGSAGPPASLTNTNLTPIANPRLIPGSKAPPAEPPKPKLVQYKEGPLPRRPQKDPPKAQPHVVNAAHRAGGKQWAEAKSQVGHSYYYNMETGERSWEAPAEGFVSLAQQEAAEKFAAAGDAQGDEDDDGPSSSSAVPTIEEQIRRAAEKAEQLDAIQRVREQAEAAAAPAKVSFAFTSGAKPAIGPTALPDIMPKAKPIIPLRVADLKGSDSSSSEGEEEPRPRKERKPRPISKKEQLERAKQELEEKRKELERTPTPPQVMYAAPMPGQWTVVPPASLRTTDAGQGEDLGLPQMEEEEWREFPADAGDGPVSKMSFGEKTLAALQEEKGKRSKKDKGPVTFKKRRVAARSTRTRDGDE